MTSSMVVIPSSTFMRAVLAQRLHAGLGRHALEHVRRRVLHDLRADLVADQHHLVDALSPAVARAEALVAADGLVKRVLAQDAVRVGVADLLELVASGT
jgi:hypothetical protein